jgi:NADP-dependent 3-hydroxy acid dehydrogenase YdfG
VSIDHANSEQATEPLFQVTGCSSGIGQAIATLIASKPNQRLIATARNPSSLSYLPDGNPNILKLALDVTKVASVDAAFAEAKKHFGEEFYLDVVVNNAGYSLSGDTEAATEEEMHQEMETLFFGTVRVTMRAVEVMRQHKDHRGGLIFNISSLAGLIGLPGHAFYHAGKFAVEGWSESVAREMHPDWNSKFYLRFFKEQSWLIRLSQLLYCRAQRCQDRVRRPQQSPHRTTPRLRRRRHASPPTRRLREQRHQSRCRRWYD